jgi:hypothetical protein
MREQLIHACPQRTHRHAHRTHLQQEVSLKGAGNMQTGDGPLASLAGSLGPDDGALGRGIVGIGSFCDREQAVVVDHASQLFAELTRHDMRRLEETLVRLEAYLGAASATFDYAAGDRNLEPIARRKLPQFEDHALIVGPK